MSKTAGYAAGVPLALGAVPGDDLCGERTVGIGAHTQSHRYILAGSVHVSRKLGACAAGIPLETVPGGDFVAHGERTVGILR